MNIYVVYIFYVVKYCTYTSPYTPSTLCHGLSISLPLLYMFICTLTLTHVYIITYACICLYMQIDDLQWELARRLYQEKCEPSVTYEVYNPRVLIQKASELLPPLSEINTPDVSKTHTHSIL